MKIIAPKRRGGEANFHKKREIGVRVDKIDTICYLLQIYRYIYIYLFNIIIFILF